MIREAIEIFPFYRRSDSPGPSATLLHACEGRVTTALEYFHYIPHSRAGCYINGGYEPCLASKEADKAGTWPWLVVLDYAPRLTEEGRVTLVLHEHSANVYADTLIFFGGRKMIELILLTALYFLPWILAKLRGHRNSGSNPATESAPRLDCTWLDNRVNMVCD